MKIENVMNIFSSKNCNGLIGSIETTTKVSTTDKSINLFKHAEHSVRFGCNYENLSLTKENRSNGQQKSTKKSNELWLIDNIVSYNTNTEKYKVRVDRLKEHANSQDYFILDDNNNKIVVSNEYAKSLIKQSKPSTYINPVWSICIENINSINV